VVGVGRPALMLGVEDDPTYSEHAVTMRAGDALVLFTDGVSDCAVGGVALGLEGVTSVLQSASGTAAEITGGLADAALRGSVGHDDVVVLTVRIDPGP
ncbi:MAG: SpoIIE family protein phosphatase, partial [Acidimicrobiales bacterium]